MKYAKLFEETNIGKLKLKNRTSMAPMGPVGYADAFGGFNQRLQDYYVARARNNVGLIITGICSVDLSIEEIPESGLPCPTKSPIAFIHSTYAMNERIHAYGSKCFLQLTGGLGRSALPGFAGKSIAPSPATNRFVPSIEHREMTKEEIQRLIQKFIESAAIAKQSGFDGVEVHAVHEGYLLDQFAMELFNQRNDEYGGSLENRLRIPIEIVKGIKKVCGEDFPVSLRYSIKSFMKALRQGALPGEEFEEVGRDTEEGIAAAKILVEAGYDALNVDAGTYDSWYWNHPPMYFEEGMYREFGRTLKKEVDVPIILAGRLDDPEIALDALDGCCDIVSYGRALLADVEYVEKIRTDRLDEVRPCLGCHEGCLGHISKGPISCAVNPACGREEIYDFLPTQEKKKVLIIGGGVAGLEVARVSAERGYEVVLCEKTGRVGGTLIPGGTPPFKRYDHRLIAYYEKQLELLGIDLRLNTEVKPEEVEGFGADVVVCATGATPRRIQLPGKMESFVADDLLMKRVEPGDNISIIGGGLVGCELGLWMAQQGKKVTVIELTPEILGGPHNLPHMNYYMLMDLLKFHKVEILTESSVVDTMDGEIKVQTPEGERIIKTDTLVTAVGYKENPGIYNEIKDMKKPVYNIGDSNKVHNIMYAIWNAYELARGL